MIILDKIESKTFDLISKEEATTLQRVSKRYGAFREILGSLKNGKIENPQDLHLKVAKDKNGNILGWLLLDKAKEYNPNIDDATLMIYVRSDARKAKIASKLMESAKKELHECAHVSVYTGPDEYESVFFLKQSLKLKKTFMIRNPKCYFEKV